MKKRTVLMLCTFALLFASCGVQQSRGDNTKEDKQIKSEKQQTKSTEWAASEEIEIQPDYHPYDFTLGFAGDINLDENWATTQALDAAKNGISDCVHEVYRKAMKEVDLMCLNNEFTYSTRGTPLPDKAYTFRADPSRVEVLKELGVDVVTLANNHVYDYGKDALLDTLDTLENAEIAYCGAGENLKEAMKPVYVEQDGKIIAFVAASRAEKYRLTPQATETTPGILRCYDTELFQKAIKRARKKADFVIACVHWGTEYSFELEDVQRTTGREYLDAGADAVIGSHSHCLQGIEYYDNKPIVYSLGNFWFNEKTLDTMMVELHFAGDDRDGKLELTVLPGVQSGCRTQYASKEKERTRILSFLEEISVNVNIDAEGRVTEQ